MASRRTATPPRGSRAAAARWRAGLAGAGVGVILLGACSNGSDSTAASTSSSAGAMSSSAAMSRAADAPAAEAASAGGVAADAGAPVPVAGAPTGIPALDNRQIVRTADLQIRLPLPADTPDAELEAKQQQALDAAVNRARSQLIVLGGFVADLQQAGGSASLVLRVPAAQYDAFRAGAQEWGEVTASTEAAQDVTDEYTDVESRIASMKTSVDRIRALLSEATAVGDIITIESELSRREADLESLEGRRQVLADQVSLGTVSVTLTAVRTPAAEVVVAPADDRSGFVGGLRNGWDGLLTFLSAAGLVIGAVLPFVPLLAVVGLLGWWLRRTVRRHRAEPIGAPRAEGPTPA